MTLIQPKIANRFGTAQEITYSSLFSSRDFDCGDYAALCATWLLDQEISPLTVFITTQRTESWTHTVCEVPQLGTVDAYCNLFFPNYYYPRDTMTEDTWNTAETVFTWRDTQRIDDETLSWYFFDREMVYTHMQKVTTQKHGRL